jgi:co-chaperonin GroES (HSP10)
MKYRPNKGRVIIKKLEKSNYYTTRTGIVLPGEGVVNRELERGVIIVGDDRTLEGKRVWYSAYSATMFYDQELKDLVCLGEEDIMIFEEDGDDLKAKMFIQQNDTKEVRGAVKDNQP